MIVEDKAMRLGNIYGADKEGGFAGNVWDKECLCPTLKTCSGGAKSTTNSGDERAQSGKPF